MHPALRTLPLRLSRLALSGLLLATSSILFVAGPARATLVSVGWKTPGDGLLTLDTQTGYKWLDLTQTVGKLPSQVCTPYGDCMHGFSLATATDLVTFWSHAGVYPTPVPLTSMAQSVSFLQSLVGITRSNIGGESLSQGIYLGPLLVIKHNGKNDVVAPGALDYNTSLYDSATVSLQQTVRSFFGHRIAVIKRGQAGFGGCYTHFVLSCDVQGMWLVQKPGSLVHVCPLSGSGCSTPVPEPGVAWLVGAGFLALGARRRFAEVPSPAPTGFRRPRHRRKARDASARSRSSQAASSGGA